MTLLAGLISLLILTMSVGEACAEVYRFVEEDGTVHLTNTPTDARFMATVTPRAVQPASPSAANLATAVTPAASGRRLTEYGRIIRDAADRHGVPERLINAVIRVESAFNPRAISRKGAMGLMQLMPATASGLGVRDAFDPEENIDGGVRHLRWLIDRFSNDLPLALAAYNAGEQAVLSYRGVPPFTETREYVSRVLHLFDGDEQLATPRGDVPPPAAPVTYRLMEPDGTVVYSNIPPRPRL